MADAYSWIKALHVIAVISWMAALLYLPRLFVYHAEALQKPDKALSRNLSETFQIMERRLLRVIATPAMVIVWFSGLTLAFYPGFNWLMSGAGWLHAKLVIVVALSALHGIFSRSVKDFAAGKNTKTPKVYRLLNEGVTLGMIAIVILVIVKPF